MMSDISVFSKIEQLFPFLSSINRYQFLTGNDGDDDEDVNNPQYQFQAIPSQSVDTGSKTIGTSNGRVSSIDT